MKIEAKQGCEKLYVIQSVCYNGMHIKISCFCGIQKKKKIMKFVENL